MRNIIKWSMEGDVRRRTLTIIAVGLVLYGSCIAFDELVLRPCFGDSLPEPSDLNFYQFRASSILDGKIPYVDFTSESPPLIMYMFVVPQALGGSTLCYQAYFAVFAVMTALVLFLGLRSYDERKALMAGLLYLIYPLGLLEFSLGVQDEAITMFLFVLPLVLLYLGRAGASGFVSLLGVLTKMFNVVLLPWMFLQAKMRDRLLMLLTFLGVVLLIAIPFLLLFPDAIPDFNYYFLGQSGASTGGSSISPWHYLNKLGIGLPGWAGVALTLAGIGGASLFAYWKRMTLWQGAALVMMAFFLCYPKILLVYFMMPAVLLMMWGLEDDKVLVRITVMLVPLFASVALTGNGKNPLYDEPWVWLLAMILSLIGWSLMAYTWWTVKDRRVFFEKEAEQGVSDKV